MKVECTFYFSKKLHMQITFATSKYDFGSKLNQTNFLVCYLYRNDLWEFENICHYH